MAERQRTAALARYYEHPNLCQNPLCGKVIQIPEGSPIGWIRQRQFCGHSCSATVTNAQRVKKVRVKAPKKQREDLMGCRTKGELFQSRTNWQSARSAIQKDARKRYRQQGGKFICVLCGYPKHADVAHRTGVMDFPDSSTIDEINAFANLAALCKNHHWEYDHDQLSPEDQEQFSRGLGRLPGSAS